MLILVDKELRNAVMQAIVKAAGLNSAGQGISFSLPVSDVLGLSQIKAIKEEEALSDPE